MITPKAQRWLDYLNQLVLQTLFWSSGYFVIMFTLYDTHFNDAVIDLLLIMAHRIYFPEFTVTIVMPPGPPEEKYGG